MNQKLTVAQIAANQNCTEEDIRTVIDVLCNAVDTWGERNDAIDLQLTAHRWGISVGHFWSLWN
jgi:hypothetical protein